MSQSALPLPLMAPPVWAFGGSRRLSPAGSALAGQAALALLRSGADLVVGCCTGADACALSAAVSAGLAGQIGRWKAEAAQQAKP